MNCGAGRRLQVGGVNCGAGPSSDCFLAWTAPGRSVLASVRVYALSISPFCWAAGVCCLWCLALVLLEGQEGKFQAAAYTGNFNRVGLELHRDSSTGL